MDYKKVLRYIILVVLGFILFYPPFLRGLFFKPEMYLTHIVSFTLFIGFLSYKYLNKDYRIIKYPLEYALVFLTVSYLVPILLGQSASLKYSVEYLLRYLNYFLIYVMVRDMISSKKDVILFLNIMIGSAIALCVLGIDAATGEHISKAVSGLLSIVGIKYTFFGGFAGGRIYSTYQYPNVLASCLGASYILILSFILFAKNKYIKASYASLGFVILSTFILTLSRGMYLVLPLAIVVYLILLKDKQKIIESVIAIFISGMISVVFAALFQKFYTTKGALVWISLIALFAVCFGLFLVIQRGSERLLKINNKIYYVTMGLLLALGASYLILALNMDKPLRLYVLSNKVNPTATRDINGVLPDSRYEIEYNATTRDTSSRNLKYQIVVQGVNRFLETKDIKVINDITADKQKSFMINTLNDTYSLRISFNLIQEDKSISDLQFSDFRIKNSQNNKVRKIGLDYLLLPNEFVTKIKDISISTHNAWQRLVFMSDALKVVRDHGIFGLGGGAWRAVYYNYQSYDYSTTEVHSFPLQLWIESGILGLVSFFSFIGLFVYYFIKSSKQKNEDYIFLVAIFTGVLLMVGHSFIDFDFSLSAIVFFLYELVAIFSYFILQANKDFVKRIKYEKVKFACLAIIVVIATIYVIPAYSATSISQRIKKYYNANGSIDLKQNGDKVATFLENEVSKDTFETRNRDQLIKVYEQLSRLNLSLAQSEASEQQRKDDVKKSQEYLIKAKNNIDKNLAYEPESNTVLFNSAAFYINNGYNLGVLNQEGIIDKGIKATDYYYLEQGLKFTEDANKMSKYQISGYIQRAKAYLAVGQFMVTQGKGNSDAALIANGVVILNKIDTVKKDLESAAKTSLKPVEESKELDEIIGEKNTFIRGI